MASRRILGREACIALTGASGFLGGAVIAALKEREPGLRLRATLLPGEPAPASFALHGVEAVVADITRPETLGAAFSGCDAVVHMAGLISYWARDLERLSAVNVDGALNVAKACEAAGVRRLVHVSSVGAVGFREDGSPSDESTPYNWPDTLPYMATKSRGESLVLEFTRSKGLDAVVVCPASIMGPGDPVATTPHNKLYESVAGSPVFFGSFAGGLAIVDVRDLARCVAAAVESGRPYERYLSVGANLEYREVLRLIGREAGTRVLPARLPPWLLVAAGWLLERVADLTGKRPLLTAGYGRLSGFFAYYDASKSVRELGVSYRGAEETVRDGWLYWKENFGAGKAGSR